jgi:hypothetical protein
MLKSFEEDLMNRGIFTALTRRAALLTLGAVGRAALAPPRATGARKKRRKKRNNGGANTLLEA